MVTRAGALLVASFVNPGHANAGDKEDMAPRFGYLGDLYEAYFAEIGLLWKTGRSMRRSRPMARS